MRGMTFTNAYQGPVLRATLLGLAFLINVLGLWIRKPLLRSIHAIIFISGVSLEKGLWTKRLFVEKGFGKCIDIPPENPASRESAVWTIWILFFSFSTSYNHEFTSPIDWALPPWKTKMLAAWSYYLLFKACYIYGLNKLFYLTVSLNRLLSMREIHTLKTWRRRQRVWINWQSFFCTLTAPDTFWLPDWPSCPGRRRRRSTMGAMLVELG